MSKTIRLAGMELSLSEGLERLEKYPPETVRYFDFGGKDTQETSNSVTLADFGRLLFVNPRISGNDARLIIRKADEASWERVSSDAEFGDAVPDSMLFDGADKLYRSFLGPGLRHAKVSKVLYLKRPRFFPILDAEVRRIYAERRSELGTYWEAIRQDVVVNADGFSALREELVRRGDPHQRRLALLPSQRLMDIIAWQTARSDT